MKWWGWSCCTGGYGTPAGNKLRVLLCLRFPLRCNPCSISLRYNGGCIWLTGAWLTCSRALITENEAQDEVKLSAASIVPSKGLGFVSRQQGSTGRDVTGRGNARQNRDRSKAMTRVPMLLSHFTSLKTHTEKYCRRLLAQAIHVYSQTLYGRRHLDFFLRLGVIRRVEAPRSRGGYPQPSGIRCSSPSIGSVRTVVSFTGRGDLRSGRAYDVRDVRYDREFRSFRCWHL